MASKPTAEDVELASEAVAVADATRYVREFEAAGSVETAELYASYRVSRALLARQRQATEVAVLRAHVNAAHALRLAQDPDTDSADYWRAFEAAGAAQKALDAFDRDA